MINLQAATLSELKAYCRQHAIAIVGDKRKKQSYIDAIDAITNVEKTSFDEIKTYVRNQTTNSLDYNYIDDCVTLNFTLYSDLIGTTIERSNYWVLIDKLESVCKLGMVNLRYVQMSNFYTVYTIQITGSIPVVVWELIKKWSDRVLLHPIIDDCHYRDMIANDCINSWYHWQYEQLKTILLFKHKLDLSYFAKGKFNDESLLEFLCERGFLENTAEKNAYRHYDLDIESIAIALLDQFCFVSA